MRPTTSRWLFIGLIALVIWRLLPLSTEQEMVAANRAWRTGHFDEATRIWSPLAAQGQPRAQALMGWSHEVGQGASRISIRPSASIASRRRQGIPSANIGWQSSICAVSGSSEICAKPFTGWIRQPVMVTSRPC